MNLGAFMSRESNKANLAGFLRLEHSFESPTCGKDSVWIGTSDDFVKLQQVDSVSL